MLGFQYLCSFEVITPMCPQITMLIIQWCINASCNNFTSIETVVDFSNLKWVMGECFSNLTEYIMHFLFLLFYPSCSLLPQLLSWQKNSGPQFCHLHNSSMICSPLLCPLPDDLHLSHHSFFMCLHLPTFALTLGNRISMRGNIRSSSALSGKIWSCSY